MVIEQDREQKLSKFTNMFQRSLQVIRFGDTRIELYKYPFFSFCLLETLFGVFLDM